MQDDEAHSSPRSGRRALFLLAVGAFSGAALAAVGALRPAPDAFPPGAIARVNDRAIQSESYERAWRKVASEKRNPMSEADRALVLKRLIEEELLIQRGETIGLVESDAVVRRSIASAMIQSIVAESEALLPDEAALRDFYGENRRYFAPAPQLHVRQALFSPRPQEAPSGARERARAARRAIAEGLSFDAARERYADVPLLTIPDAPLPAHKLQQYIGPTALEGARALQVLEVSEPLESAAGLRILQLIAATSAESPEFHAIRDRVESAFQRDAAARALRDSLGRLWREAKISLGPEAPQGLEGNN